MAQLEITDKDIATVAQLHDRLWEKGGVSTELHDRFINLMIRMNDAINHEKKREKLIKTLVEKTLREFNELK